ncbi:MAG: 4Fe-4S dicluster domain-containing protein [Bacillota bacterium]|nr:4Fe-4S dicluster domain-containing protein [Bacillota bacterium]
MKLTPNSFVVANSNKCKGCKACEIACFAAHNKNNNVGLTVGTVTTPVIPRLNVIKAEDLEVPVQCRHCEAAPCANVCPVGAIVQQDNTIIIDEKACVGCKSCLLACPIGAIDLYPMYDKGEEVMQVNLKTVQQEKLENKVKQTAYKCDLCIEQGKPACVEACPENALSLVTPMKEKKQRNREAALSLLKTMNNY